jgi:hypothetical protein
MKRIPRINAIDDINKIDDVGVLLWGLVRRRINTGEELTRACGV